MLESLREDWACLAQPRWPLVVSVTNKGRGGESVEKEQQYNNCLCSDSRKGVDIWYRISCVLPENCRII